MKVFLDTTRHTPCTGCNIPDGKIVAYPKVEGLTPLTPQWMFLMIVFIVMVYVGVIYAISQQKLAAASPVAPLTIAAH